jgi:hypothetical protein
MKMRMMGWVAKAFVAVVVSSLLGGCGAIQNAAKEDPMKCERDPKCQKKRTRANDCSTQCVDDPACLERCEQIQQQTGGARLGH